MHASSVPHMSYGPVVAGGYHRGTMVASAIGLKVLLPEYTTGNFAVHDCDFYVFVRSRMNEFVNSDIVRHIYHMHIACSGKEAGDWVSSEEVQGDAAGARYRHPFRRLPESPSHGPQEG